MVLPTLSMIASASRAGSAKRAGPAPERRKAGGKYHRAIDNLLVGDDALAQAGDADVEHRQDQTVDHIRRRCGSVVFGFDRMAVLPSIEALAGFLAELAFGDFVLE